MRRSLPCAFLIGAIINLTLFLRVEPALAVNPVLLSAADRLVRMYKCSVRRFDVATGTNLADPAPQVNYQNYFPRCYRTQYRQLTENYDIPTPSGIRRFTGPQLRDSDGERIAEGLSPVYMVENIYCLDPNPNPPSPKTCRPLAIAYCRDLTNAAANPMLAKTPVFLCPWAAYRNIWEQNYTNPPP